MAIVKAPAEILKDAEISEVFYDFFTKVEIIGRNYQTVTFRVQGRNLPEDDTRIEPILYKFEGSKTFNN